MSQKFFSVITAMVATCALLVAAAGAQTFTGVLTQHNDVSRTGQNLTETVLTPENVTSSMFGKVFSFAVDGQMYAQPLYVPNVTLPKGGVHNVVYLVTENDSAYAFDADGKSTSPLWHVSYINPATGITPVPCGTDGSTTDISCNIFPYYGITGTPVIDPTTDTMYFVVRTAETVSGITNYYQRLHAVDITSGAEKFGGPVAIQASVPGTGSGSVGGTVNYSPLADIQRAGLALVNGTVYIGWAGAQHGWIMGYNAATLEQTEVFNTAPNAVLGGVWQTGNGLVADSAGNLYVPIGDALFDANTGGPDYGDTLLKLTPNPATVSFDVADYFTPMDQLCRQGNDLDLGSAGPILLPTQGGSVPNELLVIGKSGTGISGTTCDTADVYLLNLDDLGEYNPTQDQVIEKLTDPAVGNAQGFWSSPAFWQGTENASGTSGTSYVYMAGTSTLRGGNGGAPLDQYELNGVTGTETAQLTLLASSTNTFPQGSTPSVSSNGATNGIVWAIERIDSLDQQPGDLPAILWAYNATTLAKLYSSSDKTNGRDQMGCANKFQTPTIANGRVYAATQTQLDVFGLLSKSSGPLLATSSPCNTFPNTPIGTLSASWVVSLKNIGNATLTFTGIAITGTNSPDFRLSNKCGASLAPLTSCNLLVAFHPSLGLPETAFVTIKDNAVGSPHNIGLIGSGEQPSVVVNPSFLAFGKQDVGIASTTQTVTVANSNNLVVTMDSITITGTNATYFAQTNNCPGSLPVNGNCQINVTFTPLATGDASASLTITDNASGSPQNVSLTGLGVQPNAGVSPNQINFGQVAAGTSSSPQPVTLTNNGGGTLFISSITFVPPSGGGGPNSGAFSQTNNCGGSVPSGGSCTINVTFTPTTQGLGESYLTINDNSSPTPQQVSLEGSGS